MATPFETPLMTALSAETWHQALSSQVGRDKLFRLVQYSCKLVRGLQAGRETPAPGTPAARVHALEMALGSSRQLWRLAKWVSVYAKAPGTIRRQHIVRESLALVADAALFGYLICDNLAFVTKSKILQGDAGVITRRAARFWLVAVLASAAAAAHALMAARRERKLLAAAAKGESAPNAAQEAARVERRVLTSSVTLAKHAADAVVAGSLASARQLHPSVVGAFGAFSSAVGLWQAWPRHVRVSTG